MEAGLNTNGEHLGKALWCWQQGSLEDVAQLQGTLGQ